MGLLWKSLGLVLLVAAACAQDFAFPSTYVKPAQNKYETGYGMPVENFGVKPPGVKTSSRKTYTKTTYTKKEGQPVSFGSSYSSGSFPASFSSSSSTHGKVQSGGSYSGWGGTYDSSVGWKKMDSVGAPAYGKAQSVGSYGQGSKTMEFNGCSSMPQTPQNSQLTCSTQTGCRASCIDNYQFPNGQTQILITCHGGDWQVEGTEWDTIPSCEPICLPQCQNSGICVAPNQCNCPEGFSGPQCQFENKPCLNYPPMPMNSNRKCSSSSCTVVCSEGHEFPDGSSIATMSCKDGSWVPAKSSWVTIPDCRATCTPACQNGGNCLSFNVCQCPKDFRGPQCQYSADACNVQKLQFNGGYNCTGQNDRFTCTISCPVGIPFTFPPASRYVCDYSTGKFLPAPSPQCIFSTNMEIIPLGGMSSFGSNYSMQSGSYSTGKSRSQLNFNSGYAAKGYTKTKKVEQVTVKELLPVPGVCFTWGGAHYKTFDGKVYSFDSMCAHTLLRDEVDNTFSVIIKNSYGCAEGGDCYRLVKVFVQDREYMLKKTDEGLPVLTSKHQILPIPAQVPGLRAKMSAHYVVLSLDSVGVTVKWDGHLFVQVEVTEAAWNRTSGLCGRIDMNPNNDLVAKDGSKPKSIITFASSWQVEIIGGQICTSVPTEEHKCASNSLASIAQEADNFCKSMIRDKRFSACYSVMDMSILLDACRWDYCACEHQDPKVCACETMNVYVRECKHKGIKSMAKWRDEQICPIKCSGGRIYMTCAPPGGQSGCGVSSEESSTGEICEEGCYCPIDTVFHDGQCITKDKCPCRLRGKDYKSGASIVKDCNTCTCLSGQWVCTQVLCGARCSAIGDPHYLTFDGKKYDFMGQCSYYLVKTNNFSVEAENVACSGSISQAMNFPDSIKVGMPSCTKSVTIRFEGHVIKLKQNHEVSVDGHEITKLPYIIGGASLRVASSIFVVAHLPGHIDIWWDGMTRVYVDVPASLKGQTKGLCGTFNKDQQDDFLTPDGDVEQSIVPFANKWKTSEKCKDMMDDHRAHPCEVNMHNKAAAELYCKKLKSELFSDCHPFVDPDQYYQDCLYDMCSCEAKVSQCLCPILSAYAKECTHNNIMVEWRSQVRECGLQCPSGQKYQVCGNSCTRSCYDISSNPDCRQQCVEGCNCPEGETLDKHGECIPVGQCPCQNEGLEFPPGYREIRPATKGQELCMCTNALWSCHTANEQEISKYPKMNDIKTMCSAVNNQEFTTCEPAEPVTCRNMHMPTPQFSSICQPGCKCKKGYVLDTMTKQCILPSKCPCYHGGKSYAEGSTIQSDCNTCSCSSGQWKCTERVCAGVCSAWGDSHYKTFDGRLFDYQGQCDYMLAKGSIASNKEDSFSVVIQNVQCSTLGVSCSKSVTLRVHNETITFTRGKPIPAHAILKRMALRQIDAYVIVEVEDLGLVLRWDRGTRVYVKLDARWKGHVMGLCGNYNNNQLDDFETPSGGVSEVSTRLFGDSWKLQSYCPEAMDITQTCDKRPDRKVWALRKCGVLKAPPFSACHSEVLVEPFVERCVFDSCACDQGGDCECLCTALAAYAQECASKGVAIKWRTKELCPMQCDERCSEYNPCISTCPLETCDNLLVHGQLGRMCKEDSCVEGCNPKPCPPGHVYLNSSNLECVPHSVCRIACLEINGTTYYEGDLMEQDNCHSCYCTRQKKVCQGSPCTTTEPSKLVDMHEQKQKCKPGWTPWINQNKQRTRDIKSGPRGAASDTEPLPQPLLMNSLDGATCNTEDIVDIECRTVEGHKSVKETGVDAECSLERGLVCVSRKGGPLCPDFEIRVKCACAEQKAAFKLEGPCDVSQPNREHPKDCHIFYQCVPGMNGAEWVEKTCGKDMMYNPKMQICDWPASVIAMKPGCDVIKSGAVKTTTSQKCPDGQVYSGCALECQRMCLHYSYIVRESGRCTAGETCNEGCMYANKKLGCSPGMFWRDEATCVTLADCTCRSRSGKIVKPGTLYKESPCEICQCIDNDYICDKSACDEDDGGTGRNLFPDSSTRLDLSKFVRTTVSPPEACNPNNFVLLLDGDKPLGDDAFTASSIQGDAFQPHFARLNKKMPDNSGGGWSPAENNKDQYLQIKLKHVEPIYGIITKGSPLYDEYVTSYYIMHSSDGLQFSYVHDKEDKPKEFRGPVDQTTPMKEIFDIPFEAKVLRIIPNTWHGGIILRVDLLGCGETETSTPLLKHLTVEASASPICADPMGVDDGMMSDQQIFVSSEFSVDHKKDQLKMSEPNAWQPISNTPNEWVMFDFLEPRNLTGVVTKGGPKGWVATYNLQYSHDKVYWSPMLNKEREENVFFGNIDHDTPHANYFPRPINAKYLKVIPKKWNNKIQMHIEPLGCFKPYPELEEVVTIMPGTEDCNTCPGTKPILTESGKCKCNSTLWWDGENCISRAQCPCMEGHLSYAVGTVFEKEDCSQCICKLGGVSQCKPKKCGKCEKGLRSVVTSSCDCVCKPCPTGQVLCPTSNICIDAVLWCNGVVDCPDDEIDCQVELFEVKTTIPPTPTVTNTSEVLEKKCAEVSCPPGYKVERKQKSRSGDVHSNLSPMFYIYGGRKSTYNPAKGGTGRKGGQAKGTNLPRQKIKKQPSESEVECVQFKCVSSKSLPAFMNTKKMLKVECAKPACPPGYLLVQEDALDTKPGECPKYECQPPVYKDAVCNVTGRTFHTFDGLEFKYDVCEHVLARDLANDMWDVTLHRNCTKNICSRQVGIRHADQAVKIYADLTVEFNGYRYTVEQTRKIGAKDRAFIISRLGDSLLFVSNHFGFWLIWDRVGDLRLGVSTKFAGEVDGMCGLMNGKPDDDRRTPDGRKAKTSVEFGDSWALVPGSKCEAHSCPLEMQEKALKMCKQVKERGLAPCHSVLDVEGFISRCMEIACDCLKKSSSHSEKAVAEEQCRCAALESFVVDCLRRDRSIRLTDWRVAADCPAPCEAPLVHHDCYQRQCEPSCVNLADELPCPDTDGECFPGCYCPAGYVRKGDRCLRPKQCRDCECNVLPQLRYVTYDGANVTLNTHCTYVMTRDDKKNFQVLVEHAPCPHNKKRACPNRISLIYEKHRLEVSRGAGGNLVVMLDGVGLSKLPLKNDWVVVKRVPARHINVVVTKLQLEMTVYYPTLGASVKVPSHSYGGRLEGLCGDCNRRHENDLRLPTGKQALTVADFADAWRADNSTGLPPGTCAPQPEAECVRPSPDPCLVLLDVDRFGRCHPLLSPELFVDTCKHDTCGTSASLACSALETYARACAGAGVCVDWHTEVCPARSCPDGTEYKLCGSACPATCEAHALNVTKPDCSARFVEGCFCPDGQVLRNSTCVDPWKCHACDDEGHHAGDVWYPDPCTSCKCGKTGGVQCESKQCPSLNAACQTGYEGLKIPAKPGQCCPEYVCVPMPTLGPTCPPPQPVRCADDQNLKLIGTGDDYDCKKFVCECKPADQCPPIDGPMETPEVGMERVTDESGCCPVVRFECRPETCPKAPSCPKFHKGKSVQEPGRCCPVHKCEPPKDKCIYELSNSPAAEGGARERTVLERELTLKSLNETWSDGPCVTCHCVKTQDGTKARCVTTECHAPSDASELAEYVLEQRPVRGKCCPEWWRSRCRYAGRERVLGDTWHVDGNPCHTAECVDGSGGVHVLAKMIECEKECKPGWKYEEPEKNSGICCGSCKQHACVVDGVEYAVGKHWKSKLDLCVSFVCLRTNGSIQVEKSVESCVGLSADMRKHFTYKRHNISGQCCPKWEQTGCKVGDQDYEPGESWPSTDGNPCKNISCVRAPSGELVQREQLRTCNEECGVGWTYTKPKEGSGQCCGRCHQVACVVDDETRAPGDVWHSPDGCTTHTCDHKGDQFSVTATQETCPDVSKCPEDNLFEEGCCKRCNFTAESHLALTPSPPVELCAPEHLPPEETLGLVHYMDPKHGRCVNKGTLNGFSRCSGTCKSFTTYDSRVGIHRATCFCCQPSKFGEMPVELRCEDGYKMQKRIAVPTDCTCSLCNAGVKTGTKG